MNNWPHEFTDYSRREGSTVIEYRTPGPMPTVEVWKADIAFGDKRAPRISLSSGKLDTLAQAEAFSHILQRAIAECRALNTAAGFDGS